MYRRRNDDARGKTLHVAVGNLSVYSYNVTFVVSMAAAEHRVGEPAVEGFGVWGSGLGLGSTGLGHTLVRGLRLPFGFRV